MALYIGTAGWSIPKELRSAFFEASVKRPAHLPAYARQLEAVEINSSFYHEHLASTYEKWALITPDRFRFAVKLSRQFTHVEKLKVQKADLIASIANIRILGEKLGFLLVQLPPSLQFNARLAAKFFGILCEFLNAPIALEARHPSWFSEEANHLKEQFGLSQVWADPSIKGVGEEQFKYPRHANYFRLHGSPKIYYSDYEDAALQVWADRIISNLKHQSRDVWCIFDNTALGHATSNALRLKKLIETA